LRDFVEESALRDVTLWIGTAKAILKFRTGDIAWLAVPIIRHRRRRINLS
jgi:hypothetical protein